MPDVIVIGGGVIGLSIAWELSRNGLSVRVLEQGAFGREASWAGAGMLPPGNLAKARTPEARLRGAAHALWTDWSNQLTSETGIDNGFMRCGGVELQINDSGGPKSNYQVELAALKSEGVVIETEDLTDIRRRFPELSAEISAAYYLPDFQQVRNPRHLQALQAGCAMRGVELLAGHPVLSVQVEGTRIQAVSTGDHVHHASEFIFAGGTWTGQLLNQLGMQIQIEPIKGQMVLLRACPLPFRSVIQVGRQYLVPRNDGRILVGSTEERSGFDKRNTAEAIGELINFSQRLVPTLKRASFEQCWAGLRPFSTRGKPYLGRLPQYTNAAIAAGHYRYGLHLSPITAVLIRQVLLNQQAQLPEEIDLAA